MEPKKKSSIIHQIIVAVVIALLVGSSAPWWWRDIIDITTSNKPVKINDESIESVISLRLDPTLTGHLWESKGGGTQFLHTGLYAYRAGATHIEDLPPAGKSSSIFSFDLSDISDQKVLKADLYIKPNNIVGSPFQNLSPLMISEVSIGDLSQILQNEPHQTIARMTSLPSKPLIITDAINSAIQRGVKYFQISVQFDGLFLPGIDAELSTQDSYLQWDVGMQLKVTINQ